MTAAEKLAERSGLSGVSAGAMLMALAGAVGVTGALLVSSSSLPSATAGEHLYDSPSTTAVNLAAAPAVEAQVVASLYHGVGLAGELKSISILDASLFSWYTLASDAVVRSTMQAYLRSVGPSSTKSFASDVSHVTEAADTYAIRLFSYVYATDAYRRDVYAVSLYRSITHGSEVAYVPCTSGTAREVVEVSTVTLQGDVYTTKTSDSITHTAENTPVLVAATV